MSWLMTLTGAHPVARRSSRRGADPPRAPGRQPPPARLSDILGTIPAVPGAIGAFRREALAAAGGLGGQTLAEAAACTYTS
jgi:cellulose synthase/poly-beta-1,6-N-acetylglucosamine synthase-like glycosyltransferase